MTITIDKYTRFLLTTIAVLLALVVIGMWHDAPDIATPAHARVLDPAQQTQVVIEKLDAMQTSLAELNRLLQSGKVKVMVVEPTATKKTATLPAPAAAPAIQ